MQTLPSDPRPGVKLAPFRGIRYARHRVSGIANVTSPPYDVISGGSRAHLEAADPHNVVRLILPSGGPEAAAALLADWLSSGILIRDRVPALYVYEQTGGTWRQRGVIGLVGLGSAEAAGILPHEGVMPGPVAGRRELMAATKSNLEPIFLLYDGARGAGQTRPASAIIDDVAERRRPSLALTTEDGITHRLWRLDDQADLAAIAADMACRRALIADGHHRYAAYLQLRERAHAAGLGHGPWDYGLAYLVDAGAYPPRLGAIHRIVPGLPQDRAAELAKAAFTVEALPPGASLDQARSLLAAAGREGTAFLLAGSCGFLLLTHPDPVQAAAAMPDGASPAWQRLDAAVMQRLLFARLWGIDDDDTHVEISHDAAEAVAAAGSGGTAVLLNPAPIHAVRAIAEHGERVPRKSTSFGPKPRTGLVLRRVRLSPGGRPAGAATRATAGAAAGAAAGQGKPAAPVRAG